MSAGSISGSRMSLHIDTYITDDESNAPIVKRFLAPLRSPFRFARSHEDSKSKGCDNKCWLNTWAYLIVVEVIKEAFEVEEGKPVRGVSSKSVGSRLETRKLLSAGRRRERPRA